MSENLIIPSEEGLLFMIFRELQEKHPETYKKMTFEEYKELDRLTKEQFQLHKKMEKILNKYKNLNIFDIEYDDKFNHFRQLRIKKSELTKKIAEIYNKFNE